MGSSIVGNSFDLKLAVIAVFPIALLLFIINQRFFINAIYKKIGTLYFTFIYIALTFFYLVDFGYYEYLGIRLDAASLRFLSNLKISMQVLVESYPVYKGLLGLLVLAFLLYRFHRFIFKKFHRTETTLTKKRKAFFYHNSIFIIGFWNLQ